MTLKRVTIAMIVTATAGAAKPPAHDCDLPIGVCQTAKVLLRKARLPTGASNPATARLDVVTQSEAW